MFCIVIVKQRGVDEMLAVTLSSKGNEKQRYLGPVDVEACKTCSLDSFDLLSQSPGNESFS